jgi:hypothetical protein
MYSTVDIYIPGAATKRWILHQLHSKTVLVHLGAFPNKYAL